MTAPLLYGFQLQAVRTIQKLKGRCLVAFRPGRGKTFIVMEYLKRCPSARPCVIVTEAGLKKNWQTELETHYGIHAEIVEGVTPPKKKPRVAPSVVIVSYNLIPPTRTGPGWLPWLTALQPTLVVLDEAQAIANPQAKQTRACRSLAKGVPQVIATTATPITNRLINLYTLVNILWPYEFPNYVNFGLRYGGATRAPWTSIGWEFKGASNVEELREKLLRLGMIRDKEDTLKLAPLERTVIEMPLSDPKEYQQATDHFLRWLAERNPDKLSAAERAERLVQLGYLRRLAASLKLPAALEWIDELLTKTNDKVILFAIHKEVIKTIEKRYTGKCTVIDGSVPTKKRQDVAKTFLTTKKCRIMIANEKAAGAGWSAPGVPQTVFLEYPWKPADLDQCEGRTRGINRGKKGEPSRYYYLVSDTIERMILSLIETKRRDQTAVLDGGKVSGRFNVMDLLTKEILKKGKT